MEIFLCVLAAVWILFVYCGFFNHKLGHDIFGWHHVSRPTRFNGASLQGTCDHCGKDCMQDSQGNWF